MMRPFIILFVLWLSIPAAVAQLVPTELIPTGLIPTEAGGKRFHIPAGFQLEVVAAPPLVDRPIHATFDDQGRLYVTDSSGTNDKVQIQLEKKPHRILRLEDTDGDGRFDRQTVFADRMMFPEGALWYDGSLYVAAAPSIWKLTDTNGDGMADRREEWFQGKTLTGCANDLHGPYLGPDGWIYWCKGAFAEQTYARPGKKPWVTRAAHLFRRRPEGGPIEPVMTGGMDNPIKVVFTPSGEQILNTTFFQYPGGGKRDGLIHVIYGGVYGKKHDVIEHHPRTGSVMPVLVHLGAAAPSGLVRIHSNQLGPAYQDSIVVSLFNMHKLTRHVLAPQGATFSTRDEDFVVCDDLDFHPTDLLEDADGSLLIVDTGGWYKLCCPTSQLWKPDLLGAIYRLKRTGAPAVEDPRGMKLDWNTEPLEQLAARLADDRPAVRDKATRLLAKAGAGAVASVTKLLAQTPAQELPAQEPPGQGPPSPRTRRQALCCLTRIDTPQARLAIRGSLADSDETVRQVALHAISLWRDPKAVSVLTHVLKSTNPQHRRVAAEALGRIGDRSACAAILAAATGKPDRALEHALAYALIELNSPAACHQALERTGDSARKVALIALDQMESADLTAEQALRFTRDTDPDLRQTAWWLIDRHPDWIPLVAGTMEKRLDDPQLPQTQRQQLQQRMARYAHHPAVQAVVARCLARADLHDPQRVELLQSMATAPLDHVPDAWVAGLSNCLAAKQAEVVEAAVHAIGKISTKQTPAELARQLAQLGLRTGLPSEVRLQALAAARIQEPLPDATFDFLLTQTAADQQALHRSLAVDVLVQASLETDQLEKLARQIESVGPLDLQRLLQAFQQTSNPQVGSMLATALENSQATISLPPSILLAALSRYGKPLAKRAQQMIDALRQTNAQLWDEIQSIQALLPSADVRRGQIVFQSSKAACSTCHQMGYLGGTVGPDLSRIGKIRSTQDLLEAILAPSASFVRSYEPVVVATDGGLVYAGVLKDETPQELVLALDAQKTVRIPKEEIEERQMGDVSVMPAGLNKQLSQQQLADLVKFLMFDK
jgi:putative membrane-bound dehydrogenase-like protein